MGNVPSNMKEIDQLRQRLQATNQPLFNMEHWSDTTRITKIRQTLERDAGSTRISPNDLLTFQEAIIKYRHSAVTPNYLDVQYCCRGLATPFDGYCLLEDTKQFLRLIQIISSYDKKYREFRKCYQGLLSSYFGYDQHIEGRSNWLTLRTFLVENLAFIKLQYPPIKWIQTLNEHKNLLFDNPCQRYSHKLLNSDDSEFNAIKTSLGISVKSWVIQEIVAAQISTAIACNDADFHTHLPHLLTLLEKHSTLRNISLAQLLDRYANSQNTAENVLLRNFALQHWGNPWLASKRQVWQTWVKDPVIKMVEKWLKLRALEDFFALLADDGTARKERLDFWVRYVDEIDEVYFALGKNTAFSPKADYKEIRRYMDGRWMHLEGAGGGTNAFLMRIGDYLFIEFSVHGNACHVFDYHNRPFELGGSAITVMGTQQQLKNTQHYGHREKLPHPEGWQSNFHYVIHKLTRKVPASVPTIRANRPTPHITVTRHPIQQPLLDTPLAFSITNVSDFCQANGRYTVIDNRNRGGNLWIEAPEHPPSIVLKQLTQWGFTYKTNKGWWKN